MGPSFVVEGGLDSGRCSGTVDICEDACCRPRLGTPAGRPGTRSPCMGDIFIPPALSRVEPSRAEQSQPAAAPWRYNALYWAIHTTNTFISFDSSHCVYVNEQMRMCPFVSFSCTV